MRSARAVRVLCLFSVSDKTDRIAKMLDAKYKLADLKEITANLPHLTANQQEQLYNCLNNCSALFGRTLGL